eukprot:TRINITY_DN26475_c2_g1_i1.p1 TRINITY_DN26475_c2_g1~~TRINITY_DN26475_c2_g1_i1.p1  ORF type:complete len:100 (-),score=3.81 TRINITY_DN26475_c2_g1_i1:270-569(-)
MSSFKNYKNPHYYFFLLLHWAAGLGVVLLLGPRVCEATVPTPLNLQCVGHTITFRPSTKCYICSSAAYVPKPSIRWEPLHICALGKESGLSTHQWSHMQ